MILLWAATLLAPAGDVRFDAGPVRVSAAVPDKVGLSDVVEVELTLNASAGVTVIGIVAQATPAFAVLDDTVTGGPDAIAGRTLQTRRLRLEPLEVGPLSLDGLSLAYRTDDGDRLAPLTLPGVEVVAEYTPPTVDADSVRDPVLPLPGAEAGGRRRWSTLLIGLGVGLLGLVAAVVGCRFASRPAHRPLRERALDRLGGIRPDALAGAPRECIAATCDILRDYLRDRHCVPATTQDTPTFLADPRTASALAEDRREALRRFLTDADVGRFAPAEPTEADADRVAAAARTFLEGEPE